MDKILQVLSWIKLSDKKVDWPQENIISISNEQPFKRIENARKLSDEYNYLLKKNYPVSHYRWIVHQIGSYWIFPSSTDSTDRLIEFTYQLHTHYVSGLEERIHWLEESLNKNPGLLIEEIQSKQQTIDASQLMTSYKEKIDHNKNNSNSGKEDFSP